MKLSGRNIGRPGTQLWLGTAAVICVVAPVNRTWAQTDTGERQGALEEVSVTATRVVRQGFDAPTPTTVLDIGEIKSQAPTNLADVVNMLPSLSMSTTPRSNNASRDALEGSNLLNLRALGTDRTLVLLDGQRAAPSNVFGGVDVNLLPTELVKRVDVVTGGASASWGSDAVAGVVNFVLDRNFNGIKGNLQGGTTEAGDGKSYEGDLTYGTGFAGDRGHFEISGRSTAEGAAGPASSRSWYQGYKVIANPDGGPSRLVLPNVGLSGATDGGLILAGPLKGTHFGPNGVPQPFNPGFVSGQESVYGTAEDDGGRIRLQDPNRQQSVFARLSYDIVPDINGYIEGNYAKSDADVQSVPYNRFNPITINRDNAYLDPGILARMQTLGLKTFTMGRINQDVGFMVARNRGDTRAVTGGFEGKLPAGWAWDAHYQHSENHLSNDVGNDVIVPNYNLAVDAVVNPATGTIVCRSTLTHPTNGCAPFDVFGSGSPSQATKNYVTGTSIQHGTFKQDESALNFHGEAGSTWAGPVSVATGLEYRKSSYAITSSALDVAGAFFQGNTTPSSGSVNVKEGYLETVLPLLSGLALAKELDLSGAARVTDYSTSGTVTSWKLGLTYAVNDEWHFRAARSLDIRAPNLNELFQTGLVSNGILADPFTGTSYTISNVTRGNPVLRPEFDRTTSVGGTYRPEWLPGLSAGVDFWDIHIDNAIVTLSAQQTLNECYAGVTVLCNSIVRSNGLATIVYSQGTNVQAETESGVDFETNYATELSRLVSSWRGTLDLRALGTYIHNRTIIAPGYAAVLNYAGVNTDLTAVPSWRWLVAANYELGPFSAILSARYIGAGVISNVAPPVLDNHVPAVVYFNLGGSYEIKKGLQTYFVIENLFNKNPPVSPNVISTPQLNTGVNLALYDTLGREYRAGVRFRF